MARVEIQMLLQHYDLQEAQLTRLDTRDWRSWLSSIREARD